MGSPCYFSAVSNAARADAREYDGVRKVVRRCAKSDATMPLSCGIRARRELCLAPDNGTAAQAVRVLSVVRASLCRHPWPGQRA